jgi:TetR/AcrR family tetracycline transcriptional repressor
LALDRQRIVDEAVALLDAEGLDGVTTRKLAARLGVQSPTLYWHVPNKAALVTAIADAILDQQFGDISPPGPDQHWQDWLSGLAERLRRALPAHPDGARGHLRLPALPHHGSDLRTGNEHHGGARHLVTTGPRDRPDRRALHGRPRPRRTGPRPNAEALKDFDMAAFTEQHPTLVTAITEYFRPGRTVDDLFRDCLEVVIAGAAVKAQATTS